MRNTIYLLNILLFLSLLSCTNDKDKIVGKWSISMEKYDDGENKSSKGDTWEFDNDGFFLKIENGVKKRGEWKLNNDNSLNIDFIDIHQSEYDAVCKYSLIGNKLQIKGSTQYEFMYLELIKME